MIPEFSHTIEAETVSEVPRTIEIGADETERRKLAGRFGLARLDRLSAVVTLSRRAGVIHADGRLDAKVTQSCVVTGDPLPARIDIPFSVRFVPDAYTAADQDEFELSADDCDTLPVEGGKIDLGELAAETLALALDPFPRSKNADAAAQEIGLAGEADAGPFAGLKALKERLEKND